MAQLVSDLCTLIGGGHNYDSIANRLQFAIQLAIQLAIQPRYDHSMTFVTTVGTAAYINKL